MNTITPDINAAQRRTLRVLVAAQILSGAGLAAGITVGALLAQDMLGSTGLAGLPSALFTIGSAAAAATVGRLSQRLGRRAGLATGYAVGALGSLGVVAAAALDNIPLLFIALFVYGAGTATNLQARYAGADLAAPAHRGRAVSTVLVATTVGAVIGPNLVTVLGDLAEAMSIPRLAGPFMLAALAYGAAGLVLWVLLRPDPLILARTLADDTEGDDVPSLTSAPTSMWNSAVALGTTIMVLSQLVMVAIMTMTPIHMQHHGHGVGATGIVIAVHVAAMYLPSPLSGFLVDRFGPRVVAVASAVTLLAAGITAAVAPTDSVFSLALALGLLGLGWSFGLVSGTTIITGAVPLSARAKTQGTVDVSIAIAGAGGGLASGFMMASTSYAALAIAGGAISLAIIPAIAFFTRIPTRSAQSESPSPIAKADRS
ncbi:MFS transporter [Rhodococcus sp. OK302]|uniref:MFS transporter n=1 Tax=Rhodococcus sp. OK302 TaxID=1882769 RepID=UPI000B9F43AB|nr:MFS transporter [Rhodococcus sp. OK302]OYD66601.1 putative MFS family arabinose efflux permease [Rhodococcus sp. OK302]